MKPQSKPQFLIGENWSAFFRSQPVVPKRSLSESSREALEPCLAHGHQRAKLSLALIMANESHVEVIRVKKINEQIELFCIFIANPFYAVIWRLLGLSPFSSAENKMQVSWICPALASTWYMTFLLKGVETEYCHLWVVMS